MKVYGLLILLFISNQLSSQNFRRTYGWGSYNTAPAFTTTPDGGFALLGSFSSATSYQTDFILMRADTAGIFRWAKAFGGSGIDEARDIEQLPDSGWLLAGFTNSFSPNNDYNGYVLRISPSGDTLWTRPFGSASWDFIYDIEPTPSGNFLLSGATNGSLNGRTAGWIIEITLAGNILNQYYFESSSNNYLLRTALAANGDVFSAGYSEDPISLIKHGLLVKFDGTTQDTAWTFSFSTADEDILYDVKLLSNGSIAVCGSRQLNGSSNTDNLIAVVDQNGSLLWQESVPLPGSSAYNKLWLLGDTLLAGGHTSDFGEGGKDMVLNWFNASGIFLKGNTLGYTQDEILFDLEVTPDLQLILFGTTTSYGPGLQSMLMARTDSAFSLGTNLVIGVNETLMIEDAVSIYPNPAKDKLCIRNLSENNRTDYFIYSLDGRLIISGRLDKQETDISVGQLPDGFYLLEIAADNSAVARRRIAVQH